MELEGLNHYVGLESFEDGAVFERSIAIMAIIVLAGLLLRPSCPLPLGRLLLSLPALAVPADFRR